MARRNEVSIILTAIDSASRAIEGVRGSVANLDSTSQQATGRLGGLGAALKGFINPATIAATAIAGIGLALRNSTEVAARFETALSNVATLGAHTAAEMSALRDGVLALGPAVGESATKLTGALYDIVSAGFSNAEALQVLEASARAARAGLTDTKTAADAVTTALRAYGLTAQDAGRVTDVVQTTVRLGKTTWDEMGRSLGQVIPLAATAGVSFEELNAAIAAATVVGIDTRQAITGLRAAISNILQPGAQARDLAEELGLSFDAATLEAEGLGGILDRVRIATGGNTEQMARLFGSVEALNTVLALTSEDGAARFAAAQDAMANAAGAVDEAFAKQMDTVEASRAQFAAAMESINISLGTLLLPALADATRAVAGLLSGIVDLLNPVSELDRRFGELDKSVSDAAARLARVSDQRQLLATLDEIANKLAGPAQLAWLNYAARVRDTIPPMEDVTQAVENARVAVQQLALAQLQLEREGVVSHLREAERLIAQYEAGMTRVTGTAWAVLHRLRDQQVTARQAALENLAAIDQRVGNLLREERERARAVRQPLLPPADPPPADPLVADPAAVGAQARAVTGLIETAMQELATANQRWREAETEADILYWQRRVATAQAALERLRRLGEPPTPAVRVPEGGLNLPPGMPPGRLIQAPRPDLLGVRHRDIAAPDVAIEQRPRLVLPEAARQALENDIATIRQQILIGFEPVAMSQELRRRLADGLGRATLDLIGIQPLGVPGPDVAIELLRLIPIPDVQVAVDHYLVALTQLRDRAADALANLEVTRARVALGEVGAEQLPLALGAAEGALTALRAAVAEGSEEWLRYSRQLIAVRNELAQLDDSVQLAITPSVAVTDDYAEANVKLVRALIALGDASSEDLRPALVAQEVALVAALDATRRGTEEWYVYVEALVAVRRELAQLDDATAQLIGSIRGFAQVARAASDALGLGLGGAVSALESMVTSIITKDIFGAVASGINLLSELFGGLTDGVAEVDRQIRGLADGARFLSVELVRQLAVTTRVRQDNIWGWLFGATKLALDERATQAALQMGSDIANAIAQGIAEGGEALQQAIDDILLQAAIESAIMDSATQALIAAWVAALQAGDRATMDRLRREFEDIANNVRRGLIDTGLLDEAPPGTSPGRGGGVQISEITGPTRDLFADLMAPLIELPVQTMLLRDIRDLMAVSRPLTAPALGAPGVGNLTINITGGDPIAIGKQVVEMIERKFYLQRRGAGR